MLAKILCKIFGHKFVRTYDGYAYHIETCTRCNKRIRVTSEGVTEI